MGEACGHSGRQNEFSEPNEHARHDDAADTIETAVWSSRLTRRARTRWFGGSRNQTWSKKGENAWKQ